MTFVMGMSLPEFWIEAQKYKVAVKCSTCHFWEGQLCHRFPRQYAGTAPESDCYPSRELWYWPEHNSDDWCGEWKVRLGDIDETKPTG